MVCFDLAELLAFVLSEVSQCWDLHLSTRTEDKETPFGTDGTAVVEVVIEQLLEPHGSFDAISLAV